MEKPLFWSAKNPSGANLFYLGVSHSRDPKDPQFVVIKEKWDEFLALAKNPLGVIETSGWKTTGADPESAIARGGESEYVDYLAQKAGTSALCLEPSRKSEMEHLLKSFTKEQIEYYYFGRVAAQWHRANSKASIEEYVNNFLRRDRDASDWNDFDFSLENMSKITEKLFGRKLDMNDKEWFETIQNPTIEENPLQEVVLASTAYRDGMIIDGIKKLWIPDNFDVFVVYGAGHFEKHVGALSDIS